MVKSKKNLAFFKKVFILVVTTFTEGSSLQCTDVPDKETVHGSVPNDCNDCILGDLLSPRSSWEQGWHVSVVAMTIKRSQSWMGTSPQGTMATAVKMSNVRP